MERKNKFFFIILGLVLCLSIFLNALYYVLVDIKDYQGKYDKYNISARAGVSKDEGEKIIRATIDYIIKGEGENILKSHYKYYEIIHLEDLRNIFLVLNKIRHLLGLALVILIFVLLRSRQRLKEIKLLLNYIFKIHIFVVLLSIGAIINFQWFFTKIHILLFNNDYWLLNPEIDLLIQLMPEKMFFDLFIKLIILYLIAIIIVQTIIYLLDRKGLNRV